MSLRAKRSNLNEAINCGAIYEAELIPNEVRDLSEILRYAQDQFEPWLTFRKPCSH